MVRQRPEHPCAEAEVVGEHQNGIETLQDPQAGIAPQLLRRIRSSSEFDQSWSAPIR